MSRNKYKRQARAARRDWQRWRMCDRKRRYDTEAEAQQKGQRTYRCPICKKWHRSGQEAELLATVKKFPTRTKQVDQGAAGAPKHPCDKAGITPAASLQKPHKNHQP